MKASKIKLFFVRKRIEEEETLDDLKIRSKLVEGKADNKFDPEAGMISHVKEDDIDYQFDGEEWKPVNKKKFVIIWVAIGAVALRWQALTVVLNHPTVCTNMLFQSLGLAGRAALLSTMRNGLFFFPLILLLPRAWGVLGVELAQPLADVLSFVVSMPFLAHWYRASKRGEG